MAARSVSRAQLKQACDRADWDLLDKLLEIDASQIDDRAFYSDDWGEWWGLLYQAVLLDAPDGVRVLLKHGANRDLGTWGDGISQTPAEFARDRPEILALLNAAERPTYTRRSDPPLPSDDSPHAQAINRQGDIRDQSGLVFPLPPADEPE